MKSKKFINYIFILNNLKKYFILFIIFFIIFFISKINKKKLIKVALCTMGKKENLYVQEFIDYYLKLGIDKIFIYDDNDNNTEKISDAIANTLFNL